MASTTQVMSHPQISTVTYITNLGAPTLILNMTTKDGNIDIPPIPTNGFLSYPFKNRHILFRLSNTIIDLQCCAYLFLSLL